MIAKFICNICQQNNWLPIYKGLLLKCKYCGLVRSTDKFFNLDPSKLYNNSYYNGKDYSNYLEEGPALKKNFEDRIRRISKFKSKGRILDIGAAYGFFLKVAKSRGYKPFGIEVNRSTAAKAEKLSGCKTFSGYLPGKIKKLGKYDVVTMFDVIEHLKDPDKYLSASRKIIKKGGLIAIETGNIESLTSRLRKDKWRLVVPSIHLFYFSPAILVKALNKNGFEVVNISSVGFYRTIKQTVFRLFGTTFGLPNFILNRTYYLNTGDLTLVIARKI